MGGVTSRDERSEAACREEGEEEEGPSAVPAKASWRGEEGRRGHRRVRSCDDRVEAAGDARGGPLQELSRSRASGKETTSRSRKGPSLQSASSLPKDFKTPSSWLCVAPSTLSPLSSPRPHALALSQELQSPPGPQHTSSHSPSSPTPQNDDSSSHSHSTSFSSSGSSSSSSSSSPPSVCTSPSHLLGGSGSLPQADAFVLAPLYFIDGSSVSSCLISVEEHNTSSAECSTSVCRPNEEAESEGGAAAEWEAEDMAFYHRQLQLYRVRFPVGLDRSASCRWRPRLASILEFDVGAEGRAKELVRRRSLGSTELGEMLLAMGEGG